MIINYVSLDTQAVVEGNFRQKAYVIAGWKRKNTAD